MRTQVYTLLWPVGDHFKIVDAQIPSSASEICTRLSSADSACGRFVIDLCDHLSARQSATEPSRGTVVSDPVIEDDRSCTAHRMLPPRP